VRIGVTGMVHQTRESGSRITRCGKALPVQIAVRFVADAVPVDCPTCLDALASVPPVATVADPPGAPEQPVPGPPGRIPTPGYITLPTLLRMELAARRVSAREACRVIDIPERTFRCRLDGMQEFSGAEAARIVAYLEGLEPGWWWFGALRDALGKLAATTVHHEHDPD
jgi:hypothetical protein